MNKRTTVNNIDKIRSDIKKEFDEKTFQKGDFETILSTSNRFRIGKTNYWLEDTNWDLATIEIYDLETNEKIFDFFVNESRFLHAWVTTNNIDYLICAEDIYGGQTVVDLTNRQMKGYSPNEDGFIWTDFHLSPDGKTLATIGCYWACPFVIKLFDFSEPLNLPLSEIKEIALLDNDEIIVGWTNNETLQMKGVQRERAPEFSDRGSFKMKTIKESKVERLINILDA